MNTRRIRNEAVELIDRLTGNQHCSHDTATGHYARLAPLKPGAPLRQWLHPALLAVMAACVFTILGHPTHRVIILASLATVVSAVLIRRHNRTVTLHNTIATATPANHNVHVIYGTPHDALYTHAAAHGLTLAHIGNHPPPPGATPTPQGWTYTPRTLPQEAPQHNDFPAASNHHDRYRAVMTLLGIYLLAFGPSIAKSINWLTGHGNLNTTQTMHGITGTCAVLMTAWTIATISRTIPQHPTLGIAVATTAAVTLGLYLAPTPRTVAEIANDTTVALCVLAALSRVPNTQHRTPASSLAGRITPLLTAGSLFVLGLTATTVTNRLLDPPQGTYPAPHGQLWDFSASTAGLREEPLLTAALVILGRRAGWPWTTIFLIGVALRVAFHTHYAWHSPAYALWAAIVLAAWIITRNLTAPIIVHGIYNTIVSSNALANLKPTIFGIALILAIPTAIKTYNHTADTLSTRRKQTTRKAVGAQKVA